jgi:hypothetical protein
MTEEMSKDRGCRLRCSIGFEPVVGVAGSLLRCDNHHKLETAIQTGDEVAVAIWKVKLRQQAAREEG